MRIRRLSSHSSKVCVITKKDGTNRRQFCVIFNDPPPLSPREANGGRHHRVAPPRFSPPGASIRVSGKLQAACPPRPNRRQWRWGRKWPWKRKSYQCERGRARSRMSAVYSATHAAEQNCLPACRRRINPNGPSHCAQCVRRNSRNSPAVSVSTENSSAPSTGWA